MATVSGMTAAAMQAIRNGMITGASIDANNHIIFTKYDGSTIDAGAYRDATTSLKGIVELATNAETLAGTDAVRAVTPAGLASIPGYKVQVLAANQMPESAISTAWPLGISMQSVTTGSGWSLMSGFGTVITYNVIADRCFQTFTSSNGGTAPVQMWTRTYHTSTGGGGWTQWQVVPIVNNLSAGSFTQTTPLASYPLGWSRLYYTVSNSTGWDFNGYAGEVSTYRDGTDFISQVWTRHANSTITTGLRWFRTGNAANGWSKWFVLGVESDTGWVDLSYVAGFTNATATQLQYRAKNGVVYFRGGASGTFPAGAYTNVVAVGGIPSLYRPTNNTRGGAMGSTMLPAGWEINTDGSIKLGHNNASAPSWIAFTASYPF